MTDNIDNAKIIATMPLSWNTVEDFLKLRNLLAAIKSAVYATAKSKGCELNEEIISDHLHLLRFEITKSNGLEGKEYIFETGNACRILRIQGGTKALFGKRSWAEGVIDLSNHLLDEGMIGKPIIPAFIIPIPSEVNKDDSGC